MLFFTETIEDLRYKLRCFGKPVEGPAVVFCDNMSVVNNSSIPTSVFIKRYNAIYYDRVSEALDAGIIQVGWIPGEFNPADLFSKTTMPGNTRHNLVDSIFSITASIIVDNRRRGFICTWVYLSTSHTTRVVVGSGFWACIYFLYSN